MRPLLVASTGERAGKTVVALALAIAARERGETVGYGKPKGTVRGATPDEPTDSDALLAAELLSLDGDRRDAVPVVHSSAFLRAILSGRERPEAVRERVAASVDALRSEVDRALLEGGRTLAAGSAVDLSDPDLAALVDADVVLVARYARPTDVDDVLAAANALDDRLAGVLFNAVPDAAFDELASDVVPFLDERGVRVFGTLPRIPELSGVDVADLARELDAATLVEGGPESTAVDRYVVGATGPSAAVERFRRTRNAAIVVGGDRAEIQTVAIDAGGAACLVLTGGVRPPTAVVDRAEEAGVPVLLVDADATTTAERVRDRLNAGPAPDAAAVERVRALLGDYADLDAMLPVGE